MFGLLIINRISRQFAQCAKLNQVRADFGGIAVGAADSAGFEDSHPDTSVGSKGLKRLGNTRKLLREQIYGSLRSERVYLLDPNKKFVPAN